MDLQLEINANTTLHYIEDSQNHYDEEENYVIDSYQLSFSFYDCHYYVGVSRADILDDNNSMSIEGDSHLFESFKDMCEDELWKLIKQKCNEYDKWHKEFMSF
nr:hypothetical protein [uncultured Flavobacterium sp.]